MGSFVRKCRFETSSVKKIDNTIIRGKQIMGTIVRKCRLGHKSKQMHSKN